MYRCDPDGPSMSITRQGNGRVVNPLPEGVPEGTPGGKGLYLSVYPESSPYTDMI